MRHYTFNQENRTQVLGDHFQIKVSAVLQRAKSKGVVKMSYLQRSRRGQVTSEQKILSGQDKVYKIGIRISGHPS